jgi:hypothetical protein
VDKFYKVDDGIYRSARPDDFSLLVDLGINSRLVLEDFLSLPNYQCELHHYPLHGFKKPNPIHVVWRLEWIRDAKKPLLINCQHGVDRTGIVVAAYRIKVNGWSIDKAWEEAQKIGMSKFLWWWKDCLKNI